MFKKTLANILSVNFCISVQNDCSIFLHNYFCLLHRLMVFSELNIHTYIYISVFFCWITVYRIYNIFYKLLSCTCKYARQTEAYAVRFLKQLHFCCTFRYVFIFISSSASLIHSSQVSDVKVSILLMYVFGNMHVYMLLNNNK